MSVQGTYDGLRVLDLSTNFAGPFCALILGDLGADVVKVERTPIGDELRALQPFHDGMSTLFASVNRNKRSLLLDTRDPDGREALLTLAEGADVVVESFPPGVARKLSLAYEDFAARSPRLLVATITAFGDGPLGSQMPGYDSLVQAVSGLMSFTGHPDTPPVRLAPSVVDLTTGMWTAMAVMAALARRGPDGPGEHIGGALLDSAMTIMSHHVIGQVALGHPPQRLGSGTPAAVPNRAFEASDGAFLLATASDAQWRRLCAALELDGLAERHPDMASRVAAREEIDAALSERFAGGTVDAWLERLGGAGLSVGRVNDVGEALEVPVVAERGYVVTPAAGATPQLRLPLDPDGSAIRRPAPAVGAHSAEVLSEAGFDDAAIARLTGG